MKYQSKIFITFGFFHIFSIVWQTLLHQNYIQYNLHIFEVTTQFPKHIYKVEALKIEPVLTHELVLCEKIK